MVIGRQRKVGTKNDSHILDFSNLEEIFAVFMGKENEGGKDLREEGDENSVTF